MVGLQVLLRGEDLLPLHELGQDVLRDDQLRHLLQQDLGRDTEVPSLGEERRREGAVTQKERGLVALILSPKSQKLFTFLFMLFTIIYFFCLLGLSYLQATVGSGRVKDSDSQIPSCAEKMCQSKGSWDSFLVPR